MALLPEGGHYGLVWTTTPERAEELLALPESLFLARLATHLAARAVRLERVEERRAFPLVLEFARATVGSHTVVVGNAAQTLHPVAGQGFNVGLRDAFELARAVVDAPRESIGDRAMLDGYARGRWPDRWAGIALHPRSRQPLRRRPRLPALAARVGAHSAGRAAAGEARIHSGDAVRTRR